MSLSEEMFLKLNKAEMWEMFSNVQSEKLLLDDINTKLVSAVKKLDEFEAKNTLLETRVLALEGEMTIVKKCNNLLKTELTKVEKRRLMDSQYDRLENVEVAGIPESVEDEKLEEAVIAVAGSIGVTIKPRDIAACHRLRGGATIIRLVNRKDADSLFGKANRLKDKDLVAILGEAHPSVYINQNLCPELKSMRWKSKVLKRAGHVAFYGCNRRGPYVQRVEKGVKTQVFVDGDLSQFLPEGTSLNSVLYPPVDE